MSRAITRCCRIFRAPANLVGHIQRTVRAVGVVANTSELMDRVCCTSMKKVCDAIKKLILKPKDAVVSPRRDATYDGVVRP